MNNIVKHPAWWQGQTQPPEPPDMDMVERVAKLEAKLDAVLPTLATKADLHSELHAMTWKIWGFAAALVTLVFAIVKLLH